MKQRPILFVLALLIGVFLATTVFGATGEVNGDHAMEVHDEGHSDGGHGGFAGEFLWIAIILIAARLSSLVEKWGQPAVLGELVVGILLGNLALLGIHALDPLADNTIIAFLAELGVVILLFQIGLESNIHEMKKVGVRAGLVAILGVVIPFVLGTWVIGPWLLSELDFNAHLFLGATLTATSVGITARVFKDLGKLQTKEAKIVLGAAVIDDVLGLVILAVVSAIVTAGSIELSEVIFIFGKAIAFLVGSIVVGQVAAPVISKWFSKVHTGVGMKFTITICFGLLFAYLAHVIGLAPIVGAFAAGLVLDAVHFKFYRDFDIVRDIKICIKDHSSSVKSSVGKVLNKHAHRNLEDLIESVGLFLVPIFFVFTGISVDLTTLFDPIVLITSLVITVIAIAGKVVSGFVAGDANKWIIGWGMVPRGEVGLIFATIGLGLGVVSDTVFSMIVIVVILTTLIPPPILNHLIRKQAKSHKA